MGKEVEVKILNVNPQKIRSILLKNKARFVKKVFQRNILYRNECVKKKKVLIRLREENNNCWLTVKSPPKIKDNHKIRSEYEIKLPSFKFGDELLSLQGFKKSGITEARREYFSLFSCSIEILTMPKIPPFMEIEGTPRNILKVAKLLGYSSKDYVAKSIFEIFKFNSNYVQF